MITKHCQIQTVTLTFLLVLLPTVGRSQKKINPFQSGTPIIIGDGSVHIRSAGAPFYDPSDSNWDKSKKNEYHRKNSGAWGIVSLIGCLNGCQNSDWSNSKPIEQLFDFTDNTKDKCRVVLTITGPTDPKTETLTIEDEKGKLGMVITSSLGLTGTYIPKDKQGTELVRKTANTITGIAIYTHIGDPSVGPPQDGAKNLADCRKNYAACGVQIGYK